MRTGPVRTRMVRAGVTGAVAGAVVLGAWWVHADGNVPAAERMTFQGQVLAGNTPQPGNHQVSFRFYGAGKECHPPPVQVTADSAGVFVAPVNVAGCSQVFVGGSTLYDMKVDDVAVATGVEVGMVPYARQADVALRTVGVAQSNIARRTTGETLHVRTDGSDTGCDGSADAAAGAAGGACAFATLSAVALHAPEVGTAALTVELHAGTYATPLDASTQLSWTRPYTLHLRGRHHHRHHAVRGRAGHGVQRGLCGHGPRAVCDARPGPDAGFLHV